MVLAVLGFILMAALDTRRVPGAILIGILAAAIAGVFLGLSKFSGVVSLPPSIAPVFLKLDLVKALEIGLITIGLHVLLRRCVRQYGHAGRRRAQGRACVNPDGTLPRVKRALTVRLHGRHGRRRVRHVHHHQLHRERGGRECRRAHRVGGCHGAPYCSWPRCSSRRLAGAIPAFATAPALVYVACLMMSAVTEIDFTDPSEFVPAVVVIVTMPLTFSIAHGIAFGFIAYTGIKLLAGAPARRLGRRRRAGGAVSW